MPSTSRQDQEITIRKPHAPAEFKALQEAQKKAWGITQDGYVVPVATMVGAQHHGGLVLGAFLPNGEAVGLSFSFMGRVHGELCLYSQLTGVVPDYQGHGIGGQMKWAQWEYAKKHEIPSIAWAFDPFQTGNAHFNMHMLRARARRFLDDMYGPRTDALNAGVPTDRLIAEWSTAVDPRQVRTADLDIDAAEKLIETHRLGSGMLAVAFVAESLRDDVVLLEIPEKIQEIQATDQEQASRWRAAVREGFHRAFRKGYAVSDFIRHGKISTRYYYRLERNVWL